MMSSYEKLLVSRIPVVLCLLLAACGNSGPQSAGQALAVVNGTDITIHQVNAELNGLQNVGVGNPSDLQGKALEQVIDRELLVEQARQSKLDRDPAIMMAIERSKSQILAQAYLQTRAVGAAKPSAAEAAQYVADHPELFADRKLYDLRYLSLPAASVNDQVTAEVDRAHSLEDVAQALRSSGVEFSEGRSYRSAIELPPQLLSNLGTILKRQVFIMRDGNNALLASLVYVKDTPVTGKDAIQQADQYLANQKVATGIKDEIARLRMAAKIQYAKGSVATASPHADAPQSESAVLSRAPTVADERATPATH